MLVITAAVLTVYGAAGAATAAVREVPRFARWYRRVSQI